MICPECGADCYADSVHNGGCMLYDVWECTECDWIEDNGYPLNEVDWQNFNYEFQESLKCLFVN